LKTAARVLATWFYCGYAPVAPGTVGSAAAIVIAWLLHTYAAWTPVSFAFLGVLLAIPGIWASTVTADAADLRDPGIIVVDEVIGQWITLAGAAQLNWGSWLLALALFRIFDIWKPPPVRQLEKLPGGWGIVADDAMAGVYGATVLFIAGWLRLY
jgi:phosphatidylglycerophosphatase A